MPFQKGETVRIIRPIGLARGYVGKIATVRQADKGHYYQTLELFIPTEGGQGRLVRASAPDVEPVSA